jgi:D-alanyl-D-alanine carboxypeptidase
MKIPNLHISLGHINEKRLHAALRGVFTGLSLFSLMVAGAYFKISEETEVQRVLAAVAAPLIHPSELVAGAAVVYDAKSGKVLYAKNADEPLPLASLTKLMSAEAILSLKEEDTPIFITQDDLAPEGDSGLQVGDVWSLKNLLTFGLVSSSNDAMAAAAASAGKSSVIKRMNETADELGLISAEFVNETGLDIDETTAGSYGSAKDVAIIATTFLTHHRDLFSATVSPTTKVQSLGSETEAIPTAEPILEIPGLIGAKTGYTDLAGGNLVVAFDLEIGRPVVAVVLGSTIEGRFSDMRELIRATREAAR